MRYLTSLQTAEKWGLTKRRVNSLCQEGSIPGAYKEGYRWMIPEDAARPDFGKKASVKYKEPIVRQRTVREENDGKWEVGNENGINRMALPIGISDFRLAVSRYYYVDKTLLIKDLLDYRPMVSLFTRPRRFGKTLNMDMLRVFFEKSEEDTSVYFKGTNIWNCGNAYREEQGKYPVIFLTFKDVKYTNWEDTFINLKAVIRAEYKRHLYLTKSRKLSDIDKDFIRRVLMGELESALWPNTLSELCLLLRQHYGTAPMIIIDEYDTPIQQGYLEGFYDDVIAFMRNFLSGGLKDNRNLSMAFLIGILRVAKESIFSGLNNLHVNSVLEERYSEYFGFTEAEVQKLLVDYDREDKMEEVVKWYDGYRFGTEEIFNPWSVLNYIDADCFPKTFWLATGSNAVIGEILEDASDEIMEQLKTIMNGQSVEAYIDTSVVYPGIKGDSGSIYSFLLMAGYLTVESGQKLHDGNSFCYVRIPNREISMTYEREILSKLNRIVPASAAMGIQRSLFANDMVGLEGELRRFLVNVVSFHDTASEGFYHGLMLGMSAVLNQYYTVTSNREEGHGRYDIQLKPTDKQFTGFIIELKSALNETGTEEEVETKLETLAQEALRQIDSRQYYAGLKEYGCAKITKVGIAFYKKYCRLVSDTVIC